ncbi:sensor histidine kinase [Jiulongibacter sp. NS-SX5]|uniref:sensor histidine kinase n=1 Tax=Jiulongibacter sp. NS-SX5 TaxID=3463854 RepID=UPI004059EAB8
MKRIFFITLFLLSSFVSLAYESDTLVVTANPNSEVIGDKAEYLWTDPFVNLDSVRKKEDWQTYHREIESVAGKALWVRFTLKNLKEGNPEFFVAFPNQDKATAYFLTDTFQIKSTGKLVPGKALKGIEFSDFSSYYLPYGKTAEIYLNMLPMDGQKTGLTIFPKNTVGTSFYFGSKDRKDYYLQTYYAHNINELQIRNLYQGALLLMTLICIFLVIQNKGNYLFRYYFLYVFSAFMYSLLQSRGYTYVGQFFQNFPYFKKYGSEIFFWLGLTGYFGFALELLGLRNSKNKALPFIRFVSFGGLAFGVIFYFIELVYNNNALYDAVKIYARIPIIIFYIWFLFHLTKISRRNHLLKFIIIGNTLLVCLASVAWIKDILNLRDWPGVLDHIFTLPLAVILEIVVFALAMIRKLQDDQKRIAESERMIMETEMLALRSQMNPHFVFNSLNSIRNLVMKNQNDKAIDYLSRFSKLVRTILQQTQQQTISLKEELATLELYVKSESDRLDSPIDFSIDIDDRLNSSEIVFPPMLLQPMAENAIWHGLQPSSNEFKKIEVRVKLMQPKHLQITIYDNGIGRKRSEEIRAESNSSRISLGSEITMKRLRLFNQKSKSQIKFHYPNMGNREGTIVCFDYISATVFE